MASIISITLLSLLFLLASPSSAAHPFSPEQFASPPADIAPSSVPTSISPEQSASSPPVIVAASPVASPIAPGKFASPPGNLPAPSGARSLSPEQSASAPVNVAASPVARPITPELSASSPATVPASAATRPLSPEQSASPPLVGAASSTASPEYSTEKPASPSVIVKACSVSRDPPSCERALTESGLVRPDATALQVIQSVLNITFRNLDTARSMVEDILASSAGNRNLSKAAKICNEVLGMSRYRIAFTAHDGLLGRKVKDGRAWLSGALGYQYDSWAVFKKVNDTLKVSNTMAFLNGTIMGMTSTALSMLANYDVHGENMGSWGPVKTERDGYWEPAEGSWLDLDGGVPKGLTPDLTVCKSGGCNFTTVQEAVYAAPDLISNKLFVIWIKAGVYREMVRVSLKKLNVVFLGDGMGKTVITGSLHAGQPGMNTYHSATVGVLGDGFMASNLTFENQGVGYQAVAFRSDGDRTLLENCEFIGNQDTLYVKSQRQYYKSCRILGNVDFIFGNSASYFKDCQLLITPRPVDPESGHKNAVTAHGRIDPAQTIGFVFHNCTVNGTQQYLNVYRKNPKVHHNFLGRPWKEYSRTVFIGCSFEDIVSKEGWYPWDGDFALNTLYYGEFQNRGGGADTSGRVNWSTIIPPQHVNSYSVHNFIQGDTWIPKSA